MLEEIHAYRALLAAAEEHISVGSVLSAFNMSQDEDLI